MSFIQQWEEKEVADLEGMYRQSVLLSFKLSEALSERIQRLPESMSPDPLIYPPCKFKQFDLGDSPVYQFSYEGMLPLYDKERKYFTRVRDYYLGSTQEAIRGIRVTSFNRGFIYICHFFENLVIRDLDNRNRSFLINAIRYAGFIEDDSWKEIRIMEAGFLDVARKNHVQVFVTDLKNAMKLVENVDEKYKKGHDFSGLN